MDIKLILIAFIPTLFAIVLHEVAHGRMAKYLGDNTADAMGRLSLNPLKHIDPIGTILIPLTLYTLTGTAIGYAKPVPVNFRQLKNVKRDTILVALAGPFANLLMALGFGILLRISFLFAHSLPLLSLTFAQISSAGVVINISLMVFNLIPIPPLDGSKVLGPLLPSSLARYYFQLESIGIFILFALLYLNLLKPIVPIIKAISLFIMGN